MRPNVRLSRLGVNQPQNVRVIGAGYPSDFVFGKTPVA
jgi:hypothetical protein